MVHRIPHSPLFCHCVRLLIIIATHFEGKQGFMALEGVGVRVGGEAMWPGWSCGAGRVGLGWGEGSG